jgi:hypothetical protein
VFFFDEAHLLFNDAPKALVEKVEQVVRLIRSKGVGVYFVTQNPLDVPETVLGQLGNRVQHALRAFTPRDQKAVQGGGRARCAQPEIRCRAGDHRTGRGRGAGVLPRRKRTPGIVERAFIFPPASRLGPLTADERQAAIAAAPLRTKYADTIDRESAYELLKGQASPSTPTAADKTTARPAAIPPPPGTPSWSGPLCTGSRPGPRTTASTTGAGGIRRRPAWQPGQPARWQHRPTRRPPRRRARSRRQERGAWRGGHRGARNRQTNPARRARFHPGRRPTLKPAPANPPAPA